jgi:thiamine biosynthesis lipoprotein
VRTRGINDKGLPWKIAIEKPHFDGTRSYQSFVMLNNESIATSGNYRKFKIDSITGNRYAHTIDTKTGFPSKSNLLSASVISSLDCADVDGYATAFMAMGFERTKIFLAKRQDLKAFLIYDKNGEMMTFKTDNLEIEIPEEE